MTMTVHQHWDPLKVCVVGRTYPPEFYSWIQVPHVRRLFEKIAEETAEDLDALVATLERFGVEVYRPEILADTYRDGKHMVPPRTPRDSMVVIDDTLYYNLDQGRPDERYTGLLDFARSRGMPTKEIGSFCNGASVARIGRDLFFGTDSYDADLVAIKQEVAARFPNYRNHVVNTGGHGDGTYCPVAPGLIISLEDVPTYADTFPDWEVVYLPGQSWLAVKPFLDLKWKNLGKWWIPGFEYDNDVIEVVNTWLDHWMGYVEETVFDVNMLIVDPQNVIVSGENDLVFDALSRYGITPHVVPYRHRYLWDGGIHCVTLDLARTGERQDFFPDRDQSPF